jgi:hypothetical protein
MHITATLVVGWVLGQLVQARPRRIKTKERLTLEMKYQIKRTVGKVGFKATLRDADGPIDDTGAVGSNWALATVSGNPGVLAVDPADSTHVILDVTNAEGEGTISGQVTTAAGVPYAVSLSIEAVAGDVVGAELDPDDPTAVTIVPDDASTTTDTIPAADATASTADSSTVTQ